MQNEDIIFSLICNSGAARSYAFEAMIEGQDGNLEEANELIKRSRGEITKAHKIQTDLIQKEAACENTEVSLLMVHAQDHLMTGILAKDIIEKIIPMQIRLTNIEKKLEDLENKLEEKLESL